MAYKTGKNLLQQRDIYNCYYGDFRGVDFSSDHTQVNAQRLAYCVNMYRDYQSGQGQALETIPGFRKRIALPENVVVHGIHSLGGKILIHAGTKLYYWYNYPNTINIDITSIITAPEPSDNINDTNIFEQQLPDDVQAVVALTTANGEDITMLVEYDAETHILTYGSSVVNEGDRLHLTYREGVLRASDAIFDEMNDAKSSAFVFNDKLYIIDGKNYLEYDGSNITNVIDNAYIPTTYINVIPSGENANIGKEYEQRNILSPYFKTTFIADGSTKEFYLNENSLDEITSVKVYGTEMATTGYTVDLANGKIKFTQAPQRPENVVQIAGQGNDADVHYPEQYAGIEITAKKIYHSITGITEECDDISKLITGCTIKAIYDNRVFLSGNPICPNHIFYAGINSKTGYIDPSYFGILNYQQDGVGSAPITGMMTVADTLMVLKNDTEQDGSTYFHSAADTNDNVKPKVYPATQGLNGIGCLGACVNFLDDPIFVSRLGVEAVGQLSVRYERAIEHRSSLIDAKIVNMDLSTATLEEWNGYLLLLIDGKIFMADSRQKYTHNIGVNQYEWYYLENIGVYQGQYLEYTYMSNMADELQGVKVHYRKSDDEVIEVPLKLANEVYDNDLNQTNDLTGQIVNAPNDDGEETVRIYTEAVNVEINDTQYIIGVYFTIHEVYDSISGELVGYEALLCESDGKNTGGVFKKATILKEISDNIYFGTENGVICSFNFDKRDKSGEIAPQWYTFDNRTIYCGCATKMDCCGIPHLTKKTIKKSTVIKTKSFRSSAAKIKVRTNKKPYTQIARINNSLFSFADMDFTDFTFNTDEQSLFAIKEKEKQWVEKQYYIYSDEYMKPFSLYYVSFRYQVMGRLKN